ncbi:unnamed protein product [Lactuca saligna]|uniref:FAF domain-containing protein n=1 Tax=Lactuca saligna TaxID=75948 RepID=A0AA35VA84_LACSI|nr:unnamed protein product [Lactuca saligna]
MTQMQGIVSILQGSDNHEKITRAGSLRRTLSADMSSKRWLTDNGLSVSPTMKKIASSEQIAIDFSSSSEEDEEECEVIGNANKNPSRIDIWTAIMSQKVQDDSVKLPPPYVHPLVKKSASSLSEKSLKVCTESLGSETGSDVFSSYPSSETGDENKIHETQEEDEIKETDMEEQKVVKHVTCLTTKKVQQARSLPPPISSLAAAHTDGPSLHMHSHRVDGRLVLEAVSVPQQNYFEAQRQDGRFLLTLIDNPNDQASKQDLQDIFSITEEEKPQEDNIDVEDKDEGEIKSNFTDNEIGILKVRPPNLTRGMIKLHRSMVSTKRITERDNENPSWSRKLNARTANIEKLQVVEEEEASATPPSASQIKQSLPRPPRATGLPPLPPPTTATSFNSYQYFWRAKPTVASVFDPLITQHRPPTKTKDLVLLRGNKADCLLPSLKGCKEPRRSLLMWEPFCIATS